MRRIFPENIDFRLAVSEEFANKQTNREVSAFKKIDMIANCLNNMHAKQNFVIMN
jgi:hypothetical protein